MSCTAPQIMVTGKVCLKPALFFNPRKNTCNIQSHTTHNCRTNGQDYYRYKPTPIRVTRAALYTLEDAGAVSRT
uniref:Uncharacterized protein n=1 Tax=Arundo donax TaxID=35708 RepID=A0A0A9U6R2_ARUDO